MGRLAGFIVLTVAILCVVMADGSRAQSPTVFLPTFYEDATKLTPEGKLGQVLKKEGVPTSTHGADAWRVAYVSSDVLERKTVVTAVVIAPKGDVPKERLAAIKIIVDKAPVVGARHQAGLHPEPDLRSTSAIRL
jgi:hypothetical protein